MFSVVGTTPRTRIGALRSANRAHCARHGGAARHVVLHLLHLLAGLIEMPPVSKVIPLPTSPSRGFSGAPGGL
jgi:hypothetical protein